MLNKDVVPFSSELCKMYLNHVPRCCSSTVTLTHRVQRCQVLESDWVGGHLYFRLRLFPHSSRHTPDTSVVADLVLRDTGIYVMWQCSCWLPQSDRRQIRTIRPASQTHAKIRAIRPASERDLRGIDDTIMHRAARSDRMLVTRYWVAAPHRTFANAWRDHRFCAGAKLKQIFDTSKWSLYANPIREWSWVHKRPASAPCNRLMYTRGVQAPRFTIFWIGKLLWSLDQVTFLIMHSCTFWLGIPTLIRLHSARQLRWYATGCMVFSPFGRKQTFASAFSMAGQCQEVGEWSEEMLDSLGVGYSGAASKDCFSYLCSCFRHVVQSSTLIGLFVSCSQVMQSLIAANAEFCTCLSNGAAQFAHMKCDVDDLACITLSLHTQPLHQGSIVILSIAVLSALRLHSTWDFLSRSNTRKHSMNVSVLAVAADSPRMICM